VLIINEERIRQLARVFDDFTFTYAELESCVGVDQPLKGIPTS
jgi:hypothetical protein